MTIRDYGDHPFDSYVPAKRAPAQVTIEEVTIEDSYEPDPHAVDI